MNIYDALDQILAAAAIPEADQQEIKNDLMQFFEQELLLRMSRNSALSAAVTSEAASLHEISQRLSANPAFQEAYRDALGAVLTSWLEAVLPTLSNEQQTAVTQVLQRLSAH